MAQSVLFSVLVLSAPAMLPLATCYFSLKRSERLWEEDSVCPFLSSVWVLPHAPKA